MKLKYLIYICILLLLLLILIVSLLLIGVTIYTASALVSAILYEGYWIETFLGFGTMFILLKFHRTLGKTGRILLEELERLK